MFLAYIPALAGEIDTLRKSQQARRAGDYQGAEQMLRDALAGSLPEQVRIAALNDLGDLLREQDRRDESRALFTEALNSHGAQWTHTFGSLLGLADLDRQEQLWDSSVERLTAASNLARAHQDTLLEAFANRSLGETWMDAGNTSRAEPLLRKALSAMEASRDVPKERLAVALDSLASLYRLENKMALAEDTWMRELEIHRATLGEYHPQTAMVMGRLAELWSARGDFDQAREWSQRTLEVMVGKFGEDSEAAGSAMVNAGVIEQRASRLETAASLYARALNIFSHRPAERNSAKEIAHMYAEVLARQHKGREARQVIAAFHLK
jgi:tetratricopeptide (TPR) repeat protein